MHAIQNKILNFLQERGGIIKNFSFRTLGDFIGIVHPQQIKHHLIQLEKRGLIFIDSSSKILKLATPGGMESSAFSTIPIIGAANCGPATLFAQESIEGMLKISKKIISNKEESVFAIRAVGTSMNRANINGLSIDDGDYVIIDRNQTNPVNGDYVLAVIEDFGIVKKFMRVGKNIELISESTEEHLPIHIHPEDQQFIVNGKVIYVMKKQKTSWSN